MHCIHCGAEIPDYAKFCTACGRPVQAAAQPTAEPAKDAPEGADTADETAENNTAVNDQLPASYSDPNYYSAQGSGTVTAPAASNALAIAGFVCSLVFVPVAFGVLTAIAGLILSILGMNAAKTLPENKGRGLALAGTIISAIRIAIILIVLICLIALAIRSVGHVSYEIITNWKDYVPYYH